MVQITASSFRGIPSFWHSVFETTPAKNAPISSSCSDFSCVRPFENASIINVIAAFRTASVPRISTAFEIVRMLPRYWP